MTEEEIKRKNVKLSVFDTFNYSRLKQICDAICDLGFDCEVVNNGNFVFTDKTESPTQEDIVGNKAFELGEI